MTKRMGLRVAAFGAVALAAFFGGCAKETPPVAGYTEEFGAQVRAYLLANPEVLQETITALQAKQQAEAQSSQAAALTTFSEQIFANSADPSVGPADAPVTLVEFFDYRCPHCQRSMEYVMAIAANRPNVRIVFKEFPIFGENSVNGARAALAAGRQNKYLEMHRLVMTTPGELSAKTTRAMAQKLGLDLAQFDRDFADPAIEAVINANLALGQEIGVEGTPSFVIGDKIIPGFYPDQVEEAIQAVLLKGPAEPAPVAP